MEVIIEERLKLLAASLPSEAFNAVEEFTSSRPLHGKKLILHVLDTYLGCSGTVNLVT